jgi:hypothetical protein
MRRCGKRAPRGSPGSRSGAQVEDGSHRVGIVDPGRQLLAQQFGDERARNDHPWVDIETIFAQPGLVGQVGDRQPFADAALDEAQHGARSSLVSRGVEKRFESIERQVQAVQQQIDGFVPGVVGTVTEKQLSPR